MRQSDTKTKSEAARRELAQMEALTAEEEFDWGDVAQIGLGIGDIALAFIPNPIIPPGSLSAAGQMIGGLAEGDSTKATQGAVAGAKLMAQHKMNRAKAAQDEELFEMKKSALESQTSSGGSGSGSTSSE
tara:strand:+ start:49 stop:438 length:390 start_codon:yes stop_codon:yes gene_type:complete